MEPFITSWRIAMEAENKADKTIETYTAGARSLTAWLASADVADDPAHTTPDHVRKWLLSMSDRSEATILNRFKGARAFYVWLVDEGELETSPFDRVAPPTVHDQHTDSIASESMRALLADCAGTDFTSRRDTALVMLLGDTGCRVSELVNLTPDDVDLRHGTAKVTGKGSKPRVIPLGAKTRQAMDRYVRARSRERHNGLKWLWLSSNNKGRLTVSGVQQMLRRRGSRIGVELHPHQFRHTFADAWIRAGGSEVDLMELAGWTSRQMISRYTQANRSERAREAHRRLSPMDNLK